MHWKSSGNIDGIPAYVTQSTQTTEQFTQVEMTMLTIPFFTTGLVLLGGAMGMLLMLWQKRPQPQAALVPAHIKK